MSILPVVGQASQVCSNLQRRSTILGPFLWKEEVFQAVKVSENKYGKHNECTLKAPEVGGHACSHF